MFSLVVLAVLVNTVCSSEGMVWWCFDYNGTQVEMGEMYFKTACEECECLGMEYGEDVGPCFQKGYQCPCDTRCCQEHCTDSSNILEPNETFKNTTLSSNFSIIISVSVATLTIVLGLLIYLYRRRVTSYVRVTRRLYMERQASSLPKSTAPDAPPNYEDIAADSGPVHQLLAMPPRYEEVAPPYSFAVLQHHDQTGRYTRSANSSAPPEIDD